MPSSAASRATACSSSASAAAGRIRACARVRRAARDARAPEEPCPVSDRRAPLNVLPIGGGLWTRGVQVEGYTFRPDESDSVGFNVIAPGYFATLGTPLVAGREFDDRDTGTSPKVAIVNESFARYFFGDASALGRHVTSVERDLRDRGRRPRREVPEPARPDHRRRCTSRGCSGTGISRRATAIWRASAGRSRCA